MPDIAIEDIISDPRYGSLSQGNKKTVRDRFVSFTLSKDERWNKLSDEGKTTALKRVNKTFGIESLPKTVGFGLKGEDIERIQQTKKTELLTPTISERGKRTAEFLRKPIFDVPEASLELQKQEGPVSSIMYGAGKGLNEMLTPENLALMVASGGATGVIKRLISGGFGLLMGANAAENFLEGSFSKAIKEGNFAKASEVAIKQLISIGGAKAGFKGAFKKTATLETQKPSTIAPESVRQLGYENVIRQPVETRLALPAPEVPIEPKVDLAFRPIITPEVIESYKSGQLKPPTIAPAVAQIASVEPKPVIPTVLPKEVKKSQIKPVSSVRDIPKEQEGVFSDIDRLKLDKIQKKQSGSIYNRRVENAEGSGVSDGRILELNPTEKDLTSIKNKYSEAGKARFDMVLPKEANTKNKIGKPSGYSEQTIGTIFIFDTPSGKIGINKKYYDYAISRGYELFSGEPKNPIRLVKEGKTQGALMPVRIEDISIKQIPKRLPPEAGASIIPTAIAEQIMALGKKSKDFAEFSAKIINNPVLINKVREYAPKDVVSTLRSYYDRSQEVLKKEGLPPPIYTAGAEQPKLETKFNEALVSDLTKAIREAKSLRPDQEALYRKARGEKLAKLLGTRERVGGEKGFYAELGALKGELPKIGFEPLREKFTQENIDRLFNMVNETNKISVWEKLSAKEGLVKILEGSLPTKDEIIKLNSVYGKEFTSALLEKRPLFDKMKDLGMELYNLPRSFMTGVGDFSATFMQNQMFAYRHPILTAKNFKEQLKFFASEKSFQTSQKEIESRPNYELMRRAKINFTEMGVIASESEEVFMSKISEKIPGIGKLVRATGRAYTGFLNKMRADVADQLIKAQKDVGGDIESQKFLSDLGYFVNASTGRGSLGGLERAMPVLSQGLFSARKLAATFNMLDPRMYTTTSPTVRKEALKTMSSFLAGGGTILTVAKMNGAEVGDDPTSTDFGKIKIGNTRINVFGPYQQLAVLFSRLYKGYATSSVTKRRITLGEGYKPLNKLDLISRFFEQKEHPTLSFIVDSLRGQTQVGQPFKASAEILERFIPMVLSDGYDLWKEHGNIGLLGVFPVALGIPTQTYGRQIAVKDVTKLGKPKVSLRQTPSLAERILGLPKPETILSERLVKPILIEREKKELQERINIINSKFAKEEITEKEANTMLKELKTEFKERQKREKTN